jgi:acyl dehydratase
VTDELQTRGRRGPLFSDVQVGELTRLELGQLSPAHLVRWCGAIENWHRIHYDQQFAQERDGLPERLINGSLKQNLLVRHLRAWCGDTGWVEHVSYRFRGMDVVGDSLTVWAEVVALSRLEHFGIVECELGITNQRGETNTTGRATVALPIDYEHRLPYPFRREPLTRPEESQE